MTPSGTAPPDAPYRTLAAAARRSLPLRRAWFASDFHLHREQADGVARACRFLELVAADGAEALFLLGDVFRAWLGPPSLRDEGLAPFLTGLRELSRAGVRVVILHGNHDFLLGPHVERALGLEVVQDHLDVALGGERVRLLHGDVFCTRDVDYHRLHRVLRSRLVRALLAGLPTRVLEGIGSRLVSEATRTTSSKSQYEMALVDEAVVAHLEQGPDVIVCGHVHRARDDVLAYEGGQGRLVVLGDFETTGSHGRFADGRLEPTRADRRFAPARPLVVAIDGPAGSGKSSVSRQLAQRLGFLRLDSGALYRTVTWRLLEDGRQLDQEGLEQWLASLRLAVDASGAACWNGVPVDDAVLRGPRVSAQVSRVSAHPAVRAALLPVQRAAARVGAGLVAEGRDMASVVFPDADVSVYLDARSEVRAARRLAQNPGEGSELEQVAAALRERDERDSGRQHAPLSRAPGALRLDTSELTEAQVVETLEGLVARAARA